MRRASTFLGLLLLSVALWGGGATATCSYVKNAGWLIYLRNIEEHANVSAEQCKVLCDARAWCKSFEIHNTATGTCWLHEITGIEAGADYKEYAGYDYYEKDCTVCSGPSCGVTKVTDLSFNGFRIKTMTASRNACETACCETNQCLSYVFTDSSQFCELVAADGKFVPVAFTVSTAGKSTYIRNCPVRPQTCTDVAYVFIGGWAIAGYNFRYMSGASVGTCKTACTAASWCRSFEYYPGGCYLHSVAGGDLQGPIGPSVFKAFNTYDYYEKSCKDECPQTSCTVSNYFPRQTGTGWSYKHLTGVASVAACEAACCADPLLCKAFEHTASSNTCVLKANNVDYAATLIPTASTDYYSQECPNRGGDACATCRYAKVLGFAINGYNQEYHPGDTVEQCKAKCCDRPWCRSFEYYPGGCYLHTVRGSDFDATYAAAFNLFDTYDYYERLCGDEPSGCASLATQILYPNAAIGSFDMALLSGLNEEQCNAECCARQACRSFRHQGTSCTLQASDVGLQAPAYTTGSSLYSYAVPREAECIDCTYTKVPGFAIGGYNQEYHPGDTVEQCKAKCCARKWCRSFEYYPGGCYLHTVKGPELEGTFAAAYTTFNSYDYYERNCAETPAPTPSPPTPSPNGCDGACLREQCGAANAGAIHRVFLSGVACATGTVWGTGIYTGDSNVACAALHDGRLEIGDVFKAVDVKCLGPQSSFQGTEANGVTSLQFTNYGASFTFDLAGATLAPEPPAPDRCFNEPCLHNKCTVKSTKGELIVVGVVSGNVWGTGVYTDDSFVGAAAVHQGLGAAGADISIEYTCTGGYDTWTGSTANGVTSQTYNQFWQFSFSLASGRAVPPTPTEHLCEGPCMQNVAGTHIVKVRGTTYGYLWGSNPYTDDTTIAAAAVHSGLVSIGQTVNIQVTASGSQTAFTGSTANGVTTKDYGAWPGSVTLSAAPPSPTPLQCSGACLNNVCSVTGAVIRLTVTGSTAGGVWGDDVYSDDSSVPAAAVHAGLATDGNEVTVDAVCAGPQTSFAGSSNNGVTSAEYNSPWPRSYVLRPV